MAKLRGRDILLTSARLSDALTQSTRMLVVLGTKRGSVGRTARRRWQFFSSKKEDGSAFEERKGHCVLCARFKHESVGISAPAGQTNLWNHL